MFRVDRATKIAALIFIVAAALVATAVADDEDQPKKHPLGETTFAALVALASLIARAYERLILERKSAIE